MDVEIFYPGVGPITRWSVVVSRGIVPSTIVLETMPLPAIQAVPAPLVINVGGRTYTMPDVVAASHWVKPPNPLTGFRNCLRLLDHRWRWRFGSISGVYNSRLPNGAVDPNSRRTPAELATLCLTAMGEVGFNVSMMPTGMFPPVRWDKDNPAEALDKLCRYVGCEVTGGEIGQVTIWPIGVGNDLPDGDRINPPFTLDAADRPKELIVQGGNTVFQSRLKLVGIGRNGNTGLPLVTRAPYGPSTLQSPFSYPDIDEDDERTDAFQSAYKWFYTDSQADGTQTLPGANTPISYGYQYKLLPSLLDYWTSKDGRFLPVTQKVLGKFWPWGDDAEEQLTQITYNGSFAVDDARNIVRFPYPVWNLDSAGTRKAPELYLETAYNLQSRAGEYEALRVGQAIGGATGSRVLYRPEIFYSVKHTHNDDDNGITGTVSTAAAAVAEAQAYLAAFSRIYTEGTQYDISWGNMEAVALDGRTAQIRLEGGVAVPFRMRASQMTEFDIYGPSSRDLRRNRYLESMMERNP